ncbi:flagellar biosynthesis protein FlgE [Burkholderia ubonensis]|uniref:flagellar hook protein FlgE n=1 Tax=Burkholderia ubonensis TaxID=101571 RepID=UPI00075B9387|nr:flagellar hook-basal body complex protein [Burkholderia ubonensis]KVO87668.1 flagellar biosynthesis protein FlgE [Burkholderia ubonensis]KVZ57285.1 flagellar biosynthesis protein FlgE [Burkholderia ubonensis]KVZ72982.1 flagellar biosynthesis protein FlgE [Burkholderia ubonensis]
MSFNIALAGIQSVNGQLGQISQNIANAGTYGYKAGRADLAATYIDAMPGGVQIGATSQAMSIAGQFVSTGSGLDAAIAGRGFFVTRDSNGALVYSRAGRFSTDQDGNIVDAMGRKAQGYGPAGGGQLGDLTVPSNGIPAKASETVTYAGNMSADWEVPANPAFDKDDPQSYNRMSTQTVFDSLGREHVINQYFVKGPDNQVSVHYTMDGEAVGEPTVMTFDEHGTMMSPAGQVALDLGTPAGAAPLAVQIDYTGTTMFAGEATTTRRGTDGHEPGTVTGVSLTEDGTLELRYSNGQTAAAGQLAIATFQNESGLVPVSGTGWQASAAAGDALYSVPGAGTAGKLAVGALEQSNVELTEELVNLMGAQQNYQANSKVLSTENEMMRTLMQTL